MTRILLRAPKGPFRVLTPEQTAKWNAIGNNSGNLIFIESAWKLLSVPGAEITADRLDHGPERADEINERFDVYVIPLANAFRVSYEKNLASLAQLISRLKIPVVVLGVGAQGTIDFKWDTLRPVENTVKAFMSAVLDHSPSVGVRGEGTAEYLRGLGFNDIEVIGCPSMFMWRDGVQIRERAATLRRDAKVAITISPYRPSMGPIAMNALARYPNLRYIAQDLATLELLLDGTPLPDGTPESLLPVHPKNPLFKQKRTRFYTDPWPWIKDLREMDYVFGTRIHGTITALLAGTPATVLAHDSRTLELAQYFEIPYRRLRDVPDDIDPAELYAEADTTALMAGHEARRLRFVSFLERNGLDHAFNHPQAFEDFEREVARTRYPGAITGPWRGKYSPRELNRRLRSKIRRIRSNRSQSEARRRKAEAKAKAKGKG